jgi:threonine aldolase
VLISPMLPRIARLVTHLDVTDADIDHTITVLDGILTSA